MNNIMRIQSSFDSLASVNWIPWSQDNGAASWRLPVSLTEEPQFAQEAFVDPGTALCALDPGVALVVDAMETHLKWRITSCVAMEAVSSQSLTCKCEMFNNE